MSRHVQTKYSQSQDAKDAYDEWHNKLDVDIDCNAPWHRMIQARLDPDRDLVNRHVLEIGCGRGGFAMWLARHPAFPKRIVAADFSDTAVRKAEQFATKAGIDSVQWQVADIENLKQFGSEFDTVFSFETIEHVPNPSVAMLELARVLKPGGRLFLSTPNYFSSIGLYRVYCLLRGKTFDECGQPIVHWTMIQRTRRWASKSGLKVLEWDSVGQYLPFPRRPPIRLEFIEHPHAIMKHFGHHSAIVAQKPLK